MTSFAVMALIRATLLLLVAAAAVMSLRRASAALRAGIWTAAFACVVCLPGLSTVVPSWRLAVLPATPVAVTNVASTAVVAIPATSATRMNEPVPEAAVAPSMTARPLKVNEATAQLEVNVNAGASARASTPTMTTRTLLLLLWAGVSLLLVTRIALSRVRLSRQIASAKSPATIAQRARWQAVIDSACRELKLRRDVAVQITDAVSVPAIAGIVHPIILLPPDAVEWPDEMCRVVAIHELAHFMRRDAMCQLAGQVACAIYWCLPPVWIGARHAARLREQATDDAVLGAGVAPSSYAAQLIEIARSCSDVSWPQPSLAMASPRHLRGRVAAILNQRVHRGRIRTGAALALVVVAVFAVGVLAAASPVAQQIQVPPAPPAPPAVPATPAVPPTPPVPAPLAVPAPPAMVAAAPAPPAVPASPALPAPASTPVPSLPAPPAVPVPSLATPPVPPIPPQATTPPPAPPAPPAVPAVPGVATSSSHSDLQTGRDSSLCGPGTTSSSNSINEDGRGGRTWKLKVSAPGCDIELRQEGKIEFTDDFTDIKSLASGGLFELSVLKGGVRREMSVSNKNGSLARIWKVDGRERPFDDEARRWFGAFLIDLDRQTAFAVDSRLPMLLRRGGVDAVLKETAQMPNDYARGVYYKKLAAATKLSSGNVVAILDQAVSMHTGDYYASELLKDLSLPQNRDDSVHAAALRLLDTVHSDYYIAQGVQSVIIGPQGAGRGLSTGDVDFAVRATSRVKSDYYRAEVMKGLLGTGRLDARTRKDLAAMITNMHEDYYIGEVIQQLARNGSNDSETRRALIDSTRRIRSDYYRDESLKALLRDSDIREADLLDLATAAAELSSDHYKADALTAIVQHPAATARVREAVTAASERMSQHYRDAVKRAAGK